MKLTTKKIKQLIKEELESIQEEDANPASQAKKLLKKWPGLLRRMHEKFEEACGEALRHRRAARLIVRTARRAGMKDLVKTMRAHGKEVNKAMQTHCPKDA